MTPPVRTVKVVLSEWLKSQLQIVAVALRISSDTTTADIIREFVLHLNKKLDNSYL